MTKYWADTGVDPDQMWEWFTQRRIAKDRERMDHYSDMKPRISRKWKRMNRRGLGQVKRKYNQKLDSLDDVKAKAEAQIQRLYGKIEELEEKGLYYQKQLEALIPYESRAKQRECPAFAKGSITEQDWGHCKLHGDAVFIEDCAHCKRRAVPTKLLAKELEKEPLEEDR
jgi:hypothetical protein